MSSGFAVRSSGVIRRLMRALLASFIEARKGMRLHIVTDGADLPVYHVRAQRRGRSWWIEIEEIDGSGRPVRWSTMESAARQVIAGSRGIDPSDFDLVIDLPPG